MGRALTSPYTLSGSVTLYAQWTANATDTVTFDAEGGTAVGSESGLDGTTVTLPAAPTYAGYTFDGWFTSTSGGTALTSPYTLSGSVTLYAQWTANATDTVTFDAEGGTAVGSESGLDGTTVTLPAAPTYAGYTFDGWFTSTSGGTALTSPYTLSGSVTLYARWTANATDDYSYAANGASGTAPVAGSGLDGTTITLSADPFSYPGYTFSGWNDGTLSYPADSTYLLSSDGAAIVFTAQWIANPIDTVNFDADGGSAVGSLSGLDGTTVTLPTAPTRAGYSFIGWFASATGGTALTSPYTLSGSVTLYAQWMANATDDYSYAANGGSGTAPAAGSGLDGTTITLSADPFSYPGYTFSRWSDGTSTYGAGAIYTLSSDGAPIVFTAQWAANPADDYSFNAADGAPTPSSGSALDGTTISLPGAPTLTGYSFVGWNDGTSTHGAGGTYTLSSDGAPILFTAQWSANGTDTVTFNSEGGSTVTSESGLDGTTITLPSAPSYPGHSFNGWFPAPSGGSACRLRPTP